MSEIALDVRDVSKKFRRGELYDSLRDLIPAAARRMFSRRPPAGLGKREFWALKDVSFSSRRGEAFGIIGGNGAGKSTMLKLLTGIMRPTTGSIWVAGRLSALIEVSAGFHPDLTGRENIYLNGAIFGMTRDEIRRRFDAIVAFSGLGEFIDTPVKRYSSGMFARLGFSVAAHVDADVLLIDEVLSVGDYMFQQKCIERIDTVLANGATVVFVSHNLQAVANLCSRSLLLERGVVQAIGPTGDVIRTYLTRGQEERAIDADRGISLTNVSTRDADGALRNRFESGDKLYVTVEAQALTRHEDMSVAIQIFDNNHYLLFETCTQRLGANPITLDAKQTLKCTFGLDLSLARGTFHVDALLYRYVTNSPYDLWKTAATFFVAGGPDVRGVVTLHPQLVACDIRAAKADLNDESGQSHGRSGE